MTTTTDAAPDGAPAPRRQPPAPDALTDQLLWLLRGDRGLPLDNLPRYFHLPARVCRAAYRWWARRHPDRAAKYRRAVTKELCGRHLLVRRRIRRLTRDGLCAVSGAGKDRKVLLLLEADPALRERQAAMWRAVAAAAREGQELLVDGKEHPESELTGLIKKRLAGAWHESARDLMARDAGAAIRGRFSCRSGWQGDQAVVQVREAYRLARYLLAADDARRGRRRAAAEPAFSPFTSVPPHRREGYLIDALLLGLGERGTRPVAELCGAVRPFLTPEWCAAGFRVAARMDPRAAAACATDEARAALGLRTLVEWTLRGLEGPGLLPASWDDPEPQVVLEFNVPSRLLRRFTELKKWRSRAHDAAGVLLANKERRTVGKLRTAMRAALKRLWHREARELVIAHVLRQFTQSARYATEKTNGRLVFWLRAPSGSTEAGGEGVPNGGAPAGATATPAAAAILSPPASEPSELTAFRRLTMSSEPRSPLDAPPAPDAVIGGPDATAPADTAATNNPNPPNDELAGGMPERPAPAAVGASSRESAPSPGDGSAAKKNRELRHVPIDQVRYDKDAYTRLKPDRARVKALARLMEDDIPVDPGEATYDGKVCWVTDGVYRFLAKKLLGSSTIALLVTEGTREDATWQALAANFANGQPLTSLEKQRAVISALRHPKSRGMTDRAIAEHLRVNHATVSRWRQRLSQSDSGPQRRVDRKGRTMNVENIGKTKRTSANRRLAEPEALPSPTPAEAKAPPAGAASGGPVSPRGVPGSGRPPAVGTPDGGANRAAPEAAAAENRGPAAGADLGCPAPDQLAKVEECDQILEGVEVRHPEVGQGLDPAQLERLRARLVSIRVRALRMEERLPAPA